MKHFTKSALFVGFLLAAISTGCRSVSHEESHSKTVNAPPVMMRMYVGTYTGANKGKGIYLYELNTSTGEVKQVGVAAETTSPSFLVMSPNRKFLYAIGEVGEFQGKKSGMVSAFAVDQSTGMLTLLNQQPTGGEGPCHVSIDATGKFIFVANYTTGSIASLPGDADGKLREPISVIQHAGKGVNPTRQTGPHAHGIWVDPSNQYVLTCDLGLDQVLVYKLDHQTGKLTPNDPPFASVPPGSGARHLAFGPDAKNVYVINEMGNTVTTFAWDATAGVLIQQKTLNTLPPDFGDKSYCAEVVAATSGRFVYGSNRGHDSLTTFKRDPGTGELTYVSTTPVGGKWPRNFNIDPTGKWLVAAHEHSGTLALFKINPQDGSLAQTGGPIECPAPGCVIFTPEPK